MNPLNIPLNQEVLKEVQATFDRIIAFVPDHISTDPLLLARLGLIVTLNETARRTGLNLNDSDASYRAGVLAAAAWHHLTVTDPELFVQIMSTCYQVGYGMALANLAEGKND